MKTEIKIIYNSKLNFSINKYLERAEILVLSLMAQSDIKYNKDNKGFFLQSSVIEKELKINIRTIKRALLTLKKMGFISIIEKKTVGTGYKSNIYNIEYDKINQYLLDKGDIFGFINSTINNIEPIETVVNEPIDVKEEEERRYTTTTNNANNIEEEENMNYNYNYDYEDNINDDVILDYSTGEYILIKDKDVNPIKEEEEEQPKAVEIEKTTIKSSIISIEDYIEYAIENGINTNDAYDYIKNNYAEYNDDDICDFTNKIFSAQYKKEYDDAKVKVELNKEETSNKKIIVGEYKKGKYFNLDTFLDYANFNKLSLEEVREVLENEYPVKDDIESILKFYNKAI